jgi:hypothetical protein
MALEKEKSNNNRKQVISSDFSRVIKNIATKK